MEVHRLIMDSNTQMTRKHMYNSKPLTWPMMGRGIGMWLKSSRHQIYFIGNPLIWWSTSAAILGCLCGGAYRIVRDLFKRKSIAKRSFFLA